MKPHFVSHPCALPDFATCAAVADVRSGGFLFLSTPVIRVGNNTNRAWRSWAWTTFILAPDDVRRGLARDVGPNEILSLAHSPVTVYDDGGANGYSLFPVLSTSRANEQGRERETTWTNAAPCWVSARWLLERVAPYVTEGRSHGTAMLLSCARLACALTGEEVCKPSEVTP